MRVVGGALGGRLLRAPDGNSARPTSDRAREAIFNMLASLHMPQGATVLDLFAGSGALGIEALSRGAAFATLVDSDRSACRSIKANLASLDIADTARVECVDALSYVAQRAPSVDLVFADPPYTFDEWPVLLDCLRADIAVCESNREVEPGTDEWDTHRVRRYGTPVITILLRRPRAPR